MKKNSIETKLVGAGCKITSQRRALLEVFKESKKHLMTANEVFEKAIAKQPGINFSTVYRNLEILTRKGILNRVSTDSGAGSYELHREGKHHHHLICKSCGLTKVIDYCPFEGLDKKLMGDFKPVDHRFEIYGYCKKCGK